MYVLTEDILDGRTTVLGVFDTPNIDDKLKEYFGDFTVLKKEDIRDSELEWSMLIHVDDIAGEVGQSILYLHDFDVNEI